MAEKEAGMIGRETEMAEQVSERRLKWLYGRLD